jgi:predicted nucleic acid-binding protein
VIPLVVDASVAIKWVVPEPGTDAALALLGCRLLAPDLLIAECANILWKKVRRGDLAETDAVFAGRLIEQADIELVPMRPMLHHAVRLSLSLFHPAYDCFYLALAETHGCPLVTADERLRMKAWAHPGSPRVLSLATAIDDLGLARTP